MLLLKCFSRFYATTCIHCANAIHFLPAFVKKCHTTVSNSVQINSEKKKKKPWLKCLVSMQSELFFPLQREAGHTFHAVLDNKPLHNLPKTTRNCHYESCDSFLVTLLQYKPILILLAL